MFPAEIIGPDLIIIIVVGVIVLLFGGSKLPKLARGLGSASHEFKKGLNEGDQEGAEANSQATAVPTVPATPVVPAAPPQVAPPAQVQAPQVQPPAQPAPVQPVDGQGGQAAS